METLGDAAIPPITWRIEGDGTLVIAPPASCERLKQPTLDGCDPETKRRVLEEYERSRDYWW